MDYRELYHIALKQEQHHFAQLVATGSEHHQEQLAFWQAQREKAAALWRGGRNGPTSCGGLTDSVEAEAPPVSESEARGGNGTTALTPPTYRNISMPCVRTYPDLSLSCIAERLDLPLRLWYILRQHNSDTLGDGWLTESEVFDLSIGGQRQTKKWLKKGRGIFWHKHGGKYRLAGLGMVAETLGVKLPKNCVPVPREHLENLAQFRAALLASWFVHGGDGGITISQAALSKLFGRSTRTLRRWATATDLEIIHNLATAPIPQDKGDVLKRYKNGMTCYPNGTLEAMGWQDDGDQQQKGKPNLVWFERYDSDVLLTWQMPSTYCMAWAPGPKTTLQRRASKRAPALRGAGANAKMYFDRGAKGGAVARAIQRQEGPVYLALDKQHPKTGDVLWSKQA